MMKPLLVNIISMQLPILIILAVCIFLLKKQINALRSFEIKELILDSNIKIVSGSQFLYDVSKNVIHVNEEKNKNVHKIMMLHEYYHAVFFNKYQLFKKDFRIIRSLYKLSFILMLLVMTLMFIVNGSFIFVLQLIMQVTLVLSVFDLFMVIIFEWDATYKSMKSLNTLIEEKRYIFSVYLFSSFADQILSWSFIPLVLFLGIVVII